MYNESWLRGQNLPTFTASVGISLLCDDFFLWSLRSDFWMKACWTLTASIRSLSCVDSLMNQELSLFWGSGFLIIDILYGFLPCEFSTWQWDVLSPWRLYHKLHIWRVFLLSESSDVSWAWSRKSLPTFAASVGLSFSSFHGSSDDRQVLTL